MRNQVLTSWSLACACAAQMASGATVYTNSFDAALGSEWSGVTTTAGVAGFSSLGFSGSMLRNASAGAPGYGPAAPTRLTLSGLGAHSAVSVSFLMAVIDSWDGDADGDSFTVRVGDGATMNTVFSHTFAISHPGSVGSYNALSLSGLANAAGSQVNLGFNSSFGDDAYDLGLAAAGLQNIAHTSSTLVVEFFAGGWNFRGGNDESWGMDNMEIALHGTPVVPLPTAGALGLAGFGLLAVRRRRPTR